MKSPRIALLGVALVAVLVACGGGGAAASVTPPPDVAVAIAAKDNKFDQASVDVPAAAAFRLFFRNLDGVPHNIAVFTDSSAATPVYVGETITDAAMTYDLPALQPGTYFFRCDVHRDMTGSLVAKG